MISSIVFAPIERFNLIFFLSWPIKVVVAISKLSVCFGWPCITLQHTRIKSYSDINRLIMTYLWLMRNSERIWSWWWHWIWWPWPWLWPCWFYQMVRIWINTSVSVLHICCFFFWNFWSYTLKMKGAFNSLKSLSEVNSSLST